MFIETTCWGGEFKLTELFFPRSIDLTEGILGILLHELFLESGLKRDAEGILDITPTLFYFGLYDIFYDFFLLCWRELKADYTPSYFYFAFLGFDNS